MKTKQRRQRVNSEQIMPQKTSLQCKQLRSNYCRLLTFSHWHIGSGTSLCFSLFCKSINANSRIVSVAYIGILKVDLLQKLITYIMYHMYKMICRNIVRRYRLDREFVIQSWPGASSLVWCGRGIAQSSLQQKLPNIYPATLFASFKLLDI